MTDFQDCGETGRRAAGIDGTTRDAQDTRHRFAPDEPSGACLLCGLAKTYRMHIDRPLDCGLCYEEEGEEVHPHPECPIGWNRSERIPPTGTLTAIRQALDSLPARCRYHGDQTGPHRPGYGSEACCDTGVPAQRRKLAEAALNALEGTAR